MEMETGIIDISMSADFAIEVNYNLTTMQMAVAGGYKWKHKNVNNRIFPVPEEKVGTVENLVARLVDFKLNADKEETISNREAILKIAEMDNANWRLPTAAEALAFGAQHPREQEKSSIIALGSARRVASGHYLIICLASWFKIRKGSKRLKRWLHTVRLDGKWPAGYRFLVIHK